jgi:hypothetical protein
MAFLLLSLEAIISELLCHIGAKTDSVECYVHELNYASPLSETSCLYNRYSIAPPRPLESGRAL